MLKKDKHILCGPFIRRLEAQQVNFWFVTFEPVAVDIKLMTDKQSLDCAVSEDMIQIGKHCFVYLIKLDKMDSCWPEEQHVGYEISLNGEVIDLSESVLPGTKRPGFIYRTKLKSVIQGSCRKPDHFSRDAFVGIEKHLKQNNNSTAYK